MALFLACIITLAVSFWPVENNAYGGLRFNGNDDGIVVEKSITEGLHAITVMMWVKGEYSMGNLIKGPVLLHFYGPEYAFYLKGQKSQGSGYLGWDKNIISSGGWRHLAVMWSSPSTGDGKMKLCVDGIRQQSDLFFDGGTNGGVAGGSLKFCSRFNEGIGPFCGKLMDVRVYNRALTEDEVLGIYAGGGLDGATNGLLLWYPMKDQKKELERRGECCYIKDQSGKGNHGRIVGSPVWNVTEDKPAERKKRKQIKSTREWLDMKKSECETHRRLLEKWFEQHPDHDGKYHRRFEELNARYDKIKTNTLCWTVDILQGYTDLQIAIGLKELFPESDDMKGNGR